MGFLVSVKVAEPIESLTSLLKAAQCRLYDGLELGSAGVEHSTAAIYLLGYVAEILLKAACLRVNSFDPRANAFAELRLLQLAHFQPKTNLHDLGQLFATLMTLRALAGIPSDAVRDGTIRKNVLVIASHWNESLRYTGQIATKVEVSEVFESTFWLYKNFRVLWRT